MHVYIICMLRVVHFLDATATATALRARVYLQRRRRTRSSLTHKNIRCSAAQCIVLYIIYGDRARTRRISSSPRLARRYICEITSRARTLHIIEIRARLRVWYKLLPLLLLLHTRQYTRGELLNRRRRRRRRATRRVQCTYIRQYICIRNLRHACVSHITAAS